VALELSTFLVIVSTVSTSKKLFQRIDALSGFAYMGAEKKTWNLSWWIAERTPPLN
jgi:hypothetical protein